MLQREIVMINYLNVKMVGILHLDWHGVLVSLSMGWSLDTDIGVSGNCRMRISLLFRTSIVLLTLRFHRKRQFMYNFMMIFKVNSNVMDMGET